MRIPPRISLRTLLAAFLVLGAGLGYFGAWHRYLLWEQALVEAIEKGGGGVHYESVFKTMDEGRVAARWFPGGGDEGWSRVDIVAFADDESNFGLARPAEWKNLTELKEFYCLNHSFRDEHLEYVCQCPKVNHIWLMNSQVSGQGLAQLGKLAQLTQLIIENQTLTGDDLAQMTAGPNLKTLELSVDPAGLRALLQAPWVSSLEKLKVTMEGPTAADTTTIIPLRSIPQFKNLKSLVIWGDLSPTEIELLSAGIPQVESLSLRTKLTTAACGNLARSGNLHELELYRCDLHDEDLPPLAQLKSLVTLRLESNPITSAGLHSLTELPVETLNLEDTLVDNRLIDFLRANPHVNSVRVDGAKLTPVGIQAINQLRPSLSVSTSRHWVAVAIENAEAERAEQLALHPECG